MGTIIINKEYCDNKLYDDISKYATEVFYNKKIEYLKENNFKDLEKEKMLDFIRYITFVTDDNRNFGRYISYNRSKTGREYNLSKEQVEVIKECFGEAPIYLDVEEFRKKLLITSSKMFYSNERSCLAIMVDRYEMNTKWTGKSIIDKIEELGGDIKGFSVKRVEECLNKHCDSKKDGHILYDRTEIKDGECHYEYKIRLTDLINYVNSCK